MSATQDASPTDNPRGKPHLSQQQKHLRGYDVDQADLYNTRRWVCTDCTNLVTVGTDGDREYGHEPDCRHTIRRRDSHGLKAWGEQ